MQFLPQLQLVSSYCPCVIDGSYPVAIADAPNTILCAAIALLASKVANVLLPVAVAFRAVAAVKPSLTNVDAIVIKLISFLPLNVITPPTVQQNFTVCYIITA